MVISARCFLMCVFMVLLLNPAAGRKQTLGQERGNVLARAESEDFELSARMDTTDAIHVRHKKTGEQYSIPSTSDVHHIEQLDFAMDNRALARAARNDLGRGSTMLVLDLQRRAMVDELVGLRFSLSPDKRYVAFLEWAPAHFDNGASSLVYVYDLAASSFENRITNAVVGIPVYPPNMLNSKVPASQRHEFGGPFSWLAGTDVFGFEDQFQGKLWLVIVDLRPGLRNPLRLAQPIDSSVLGQSLCALGSNIRSIKSSPKGTEYVSVELVSGANECGQFDVAVKGLRLPQ